MLKRCLASFAYAIDMARRTFTLAWREDAQRIVIEKYVTGMIDALERAGLPSVVNDREIDIDLDTKTHKSDLIVRFKLQGRWLMNKKECAYMSSRISDILVSNKYNVIPSPVKDEDDVTAVYILVPSNLS